MGVVKVGVEAGCLLMDLLRPLADLDLVRERDRMG